MRLDDLPDWLPAWCLDNLSGAPAAVLLHHNSISAVVGLRLTDGSSVVVKSRADDGRAAARVATQARLAERGFPCPRPEEFLAAYQDARRRAFMIAEHEVAWAASVWPAAHNSTPVRRGRRAVHA